MALRELVEKQLRSGISQRALAQKIGVSHGTVNNILAGIVPTSTKTLEKFAGFFRVSLESLLQHGNSLVRESPAPYRVPHKFERLFGLVEALDTDEIATLERCAEAFRAEEPEVRQHLIGQLKIIERLVNPEHAPTAKEKKRHGSPS